MGTRPIHEQNVHDQEVARIARWLRQKGFKTCENPGSKKNCHVNRNGRKVYPDVLAGDDGGWSYLYEVETDSTVTEDEARNQWAIYADGPSRFFVHVPASKEYLARQLIARLRVDAKVTIY